MCIFGHKWVITEFASFEVKFMDESEESFVVKVYKCKHCRETMATMGYRDENSEEITVELAKKLIEDIFKGDTKNIPT